MDTGDTRTSCAALWVSVSDCRRLYRGRVIRAYHRHANDFCGHAPARLKTAIVASTRNVKEAVREIEQWGNRRGRRRCCPCSARTCRSITPTWNRSGRRRRSTTCRSCTTATRGIAIFPSVPGPFDNIFLDAWLHRGAHEFMRRSSEPESACCPRMRRASRMRFGWLPFWAKRMNEQRSTRRDRALKPPRASKSRAAASSHDRAPEGETCSTSPTSSAPTC